MWISKKKLYEDIQSIKTQLHLQMNNVATDWQVSNVRHSLELFKKDVECLNQQVAELKKFLEG